MLAKASTVALPQVKAVESETSTAEKSALAQAIASLEAAPQPAAVKHEAAPFYLKPLVWLNLPMELLPQAVREAVGKIALMTLANSVAILAYVFLFRKHH